MCVQAVSSRLDELLFGDAASAASIRTAIRQLVGEQGGGVCAAQFKPGEPAYMCGYCATDPTCIQCVRCYREADHSGHEEHVRMVNAGRNNTHTTHTKGTRRTTREAKREEEGQGEKGGRNRRQVADCRQTEEEGR
jgi:hypothetical protein